mgnify:CR=1 FL=1
MAPCTVTWQQQMQLALTLLSRRATDLHLHLHEKMIVSSEQQVENVPCVVTKKKNKF